MSFCNKIFAVCFWLIFYLTLINTYTVSGQTKCCCGDPVEMNFQGLDFEFTPEPPYGWFNNYISGSSMGPWNIVSGSVDHVHIEYPICVSCGNPNGKSHFIDLYGSPPGNGGGVGTMRYILTGLTPGNLYFVEFYYATFDKPGNYTANLKISSWLNVNWRATNPGNVIWLKASYPFIAQATTGNMDFMDTGYNIYQNSQNGMLIDDIKVFECPPDTEKPIVNNPPPDVDIHCENEIPNVVTLDISDNCDPNPQISFKESSDIVDPCTKRIDRNWVIQDKCNNIETISQVINKSDLRPPEFLKDPITLINSCDSNIINDFNLWLRNNGNAIIEDDCKFTVKALYNKIPNKFCDTVLVEFVAKDECGNENSRFANFIVLDTVKPKFLTKAKSLHFNCTDSYIDSVRIWLLNNGGIIASDNCGEIIISSNFNGDSIKNPLFVTFQIRDNCGNIDSCIASLSYHNIHDTTEVFLYTCDSNNIVNDTIIYLQNLCDSVVIYRSILSPSDSTFITIHKCDSFHRNFDTIIVSNRLQCDSILFIEYISNIIPITKTKIFDCSFNVYYSDTVILKGQYCDSSIITEYFPLKKDSITLFLTTCDSNKAGKSTFFYKNISGCDSIINIVTSFQSQHIEYVSKDVCGLLKAYTDTIISTNSICDSMVITSYHPLRIDSTNNYQFSCNAIDTGIFTQKFINILGCDSIVINEIGLKYPDTITLTQQTCKLSESGINTFFWKNQFGCDSIIIINKIFKTDTSLITEYVCTEGEVGIQSHIINGINCDSIKIISKLLGPVDTTILSESTCDISLAGENINLLRNEYGCDSVVILNKIFMPVRLLYVLDSINCNNFNNGRIYILNPMDSLYKYSTFVNGSRIGETSIINNLKPGTYQVFIRDLKDCVSDTIQIVLNNPAELSIDLGENRIAVPGEFIELKLNTNKQFKEINWYPPNISNCSNCSSIRFEFVKNIIIYAQVIDEAGCSSIDSITILSSSNYKYYAPNVFSPNKDNINDYFYIIGENGAVIENLLIYDRWGELVFMANNIPVNSEDHGWDGTLGGELLNPGVFFYYAIINSIDNEKINIKGDFTLIR